MARCSKGHENPDSQRFCGECGEELRAPAAQAGSSQPGTDQDAASDLPSGPPQRPDEWRPGFTTPPPTPAAPPPSPPGRPVPRGNALAVAALAVGIVGVVAGLIPLLFFIAWVLGVLAVVFGIIGRNNARQRGTGKGQATAGAILGLVAIVLGVVGIVIVNNVLTSTKKAVERATFPTSRLPTGSTAPGTTTQSSAKTYKVGDKVTYTDGSSIQVYTYEQPAPPRQYVTPDPGMEYAVIDTEFCAGGTRSLSYNDLGFKAQMADNRQYEADISSRDPDLSSGDIPAGGGCKRGFVTLKVPAGQRPTFVLWDYYGTEQTRWVP